MSRTPACEDAATISARLRELQAERMAAIAGCICGTLGPAQRDVAGNVVHAPGCPLRAPSAALAVAMERLRARHKRRPMTEDEIVAEGIAQKYARHRIYAPAGPQSELAFERNPIPWLGRWGSGDFHTSPSGGAGSRLDVGRLPDAAGSTNPASLEGLK